MQIIIHLIFNYHLFMFVLSTFDIVSEDIFLGAECIFILSLWYGKSIEHSLILKIDKKIVKNEMGNGSSLF